MSELVSAGGAKRLDKWAVSERSWDRSIVVGQTKIRAIDGDAGEAVALAQGEALLAIARRLGLLDEEGG